MAGSEILGTGTHWLTRHPDGPDEGASKIETHLFLGRYGWSVSYYVTIDENLAVPKARRASKRTDGLWQHTCFELFLKPANGTRYFEFNLSPTTQWAAYEFDDYREGMRPLHMGAPSIFPSVFRNILRLDARLDWRDRPADTGWMIGLAAVIETIGGQKAYWALSHRRNRPPDFHDPVGFTAKLSPYPRPSSPRT